MKAATKKPDAYLQTKVMTANPAELRLMLFDGAIRFAQQARDALAGRNWEAAFNGITRCQQILLELTNSLRPEHDPALCKNLAALYTYLYTCLIHANSERDPEIVDEVLKLLNFERQTWSMLLDQLAAENKAAAKAMELPDDVSPSLPQPSASSALNTLVGATVSVRG